MRPPIVEDGDGVGMGQTRVSWTSRSKRRRLISPV
jgi:hypothetical protein